MRLKNRSSALSHSKVSQSLLYRDRSQSEESIATELCDGPVSDNEAQSLALAEPTGDLDKPLEGHDRQALVDIIKKRQKHAWGIPQDPSPSSSPPLDSTFGSDLPSRSSARKLQLQDGDQELHDRNAAGLETQRPRSALHSGDFSTTQFTQGFDLSAETSSTSKPISISAPRSAFHDPLPARKITPSIGLAFQSASQNRAGLISGGSPDNTAPPSSCPSPRYVLKTPTSPLVWEAGELELDLDKSVSSEQPRRVNRRHTLSPLVASSYSNDYSRLAAAARTRVTLRREETMPSHSLGYRTRRSFSSQLPRETVNSPPAGQYTRARTVSLSSDASPRQSTMVGSYEESILRGRMSGAPSHPLTFEACIGALGKGDCRPMMPAHVKIDFFAVFYSWTGGHGRVGSVHQERSPYVGCIDLENTLQPPRLKREKKSRGRPAVPIDSDDFPVTESEFHGHRKWNMGLNEGVDASQRRRKTTPNIGGAYRIPQKGSLQLIIKNQNKTAVKVFVLPYNLEGMKSHQRTWLRQRVYSGGPVVGQPISSSPTAAQSNVRDKSMRANTRPTLRYLVHFKICCMHARFYLYDEIRVVFANRVPGYKENVRSEIMMPEPKYMPFMMPSRMTRSLNNNEATSANGESDIFAGLHPSLAESLPISYSYEAAMPQSTATDGSEDSTQSVETVRVPVLPQSFIKKTDDPDTNHIETRENVSERASSPAGGAPQINTGGMIPAEIAILRDIDGQDNPAEYWASPAGNMTEQCLNPFFTKLSRDDTRYGGLPGRHDQPEPGEGLIARRLRSLGMNTNSHSDNGAVP